MRWALSIVFACVLPWSARAAERTLDERPAGESEWGYHPAAGSVSAVTPPSFSWRPQGDIDTWELEVGRGGGFEDVFYRASGIKWNVHCPPEAFPAGTYTWRYRGIDGDGNHTRWSTPRTFSIAYGAREMPMPPRSELLARIPQSHPRLFVRPEDLPRLRELARGPLKDRYDDLVAQCERLLADPPPTAEPPKYPPGTERLSERWREIWWGNREYTIRALNGAATLGFTRLLGGKEEYGRLAKRILLDCAQWDPKGSTGYRYNDEAGMPYAYYFARTYTFVHDLLSEEERALCRRVMKVRGEEMYRHLFPRHLWRPYSSHSNRAWHFLGEVGIAFLGEIEGADDWVWFAMNVFDNVYPVWCDENGGWHEGSSYWSSYISRFTWWADVMRAAVEVDAYEKPYFSQAGYYPMYLMPPGKRGGGLGDLTARRTAGSNRALMSVLAAQSGNGHWQWYVNRLGGPVESGGYVGFVRGALPQVTPIPPDDLPTSRLFRGTGQAYLNTTLRHADEDVQVVFKSSPFGTQSHGYEANNSLLLWAYGERLLIRSGYRDIYGSEHHRNWMWSTRSANSITVGGEGQGKRTADAQGRIVDFQTTPAIDAVVGEAGGAYRLTFGGKLDKPVPLDRFTRVILFVKPEMVIVFDRLESPRPSTFEYWLHALEEMKVTDQRDIRVQAGDVACDVTFLAPEGLTFSQTNQYDPNPRPRIRLREWHLTATTPGKSKSVQFVALYRPHRVGEKVPRDAELKTIDGGYALTVKLRDGQAIALLPTDDSATLQYDGLTTADGEVILQRRAADGSPSHTVQVTTR